MNVSQPEVFAAAMALDPIERGALATQLLQSLEDLPPSQQRSAEEWNREIERRIDASLSGDGASIDLNEAIGRIRSAGRSRGGDRVVSPAKPGG